MNKEILFFYEPTGYYGCLSNWYKCNFEYAGIKYTSTEQYMMYQKAIIFHDSNIANKILVESDLDIIKKLGRSVSNYDDAIWSSVRGQILRRGIRAKFIQNEDLLEILLGTRDNILAELAPYDKVWGVGLKDTDSNLFNMSKWPGQNLLGKTLMQVRDDIKRMMERSSNNIISYNNYRHMPYTDLWSTSIEELYKILDEKEFLDAYINIVDPVFKSKDFNKQSFANIESDILNPWHGACPITTFWEFKQDFYEMGIYGLFKKNINVAKYDLYFFSKYWLQNLSNLNLLEHEFQDDMNKLSFNMDCGKSLRDKYPQLDVLNSNKDLLSIIDKETDIDILTSALYSKYRYITHWSQLNLTDDDNKEWFGIVLNQLLNQSK